jgi:hypothetical protein
MVAFRKCNGHMMIADDIYNPSFIMEVVLVKTVCTDELLEIIKNQDWDSLFLLLMNDCPEQVIVDCDLREHALEEFAGKEAYERWLETH